MEERNNKKKKSNSWVYKIFIITFILSLAMGFIADSTVQNLNIIFAMIILLSIIAIGITFDIVGMSVTSADEVTFHAKATKKQQGAAEAIRLVKYADKVSSVCNDVVGDVCGIISGSVAALIAIKISLAFNIPTTIISLITGAVVASITVGGKAIGKAFAIKNAEKIVGWVGKIISYISPVKK